jgi:hypothetical protein
MSSLNAYCFGYPCAVGSTHRTFLWVELSNSNKFGLTPLLPAVLSLVEFQKADRVLDYPCRRCESLSE